MVILRNFPLHGKHLTCFSSRHEFFVEERKLAMFCHGINHVCFVILRAVFIRFFHLLLFLHNMTWNYQYPVNINGKSWLLSMKESVQNDWVVLGVNIAPSTCWRNFSWKKEPIPGFPLFVKVAYLTITPCFTDRIHGVPRRGVLWRHCSGQHYPHRRTMPMTDARHNRCHREWQVIYLRFRCRDATANPSSRAIFFSIAWIFFFCLFVCFEMSKI